MAEAQPVRCHGAFVQYRDGTTRTFEECKHIKTILPTGEPLYVFEVDEGEFLEVTTLHGNEVREVTIKPFVVREVITA